MPRLLTAVTAFVVLFAVASGGYKLAGGEADLRIFASLGMTPMGVRLFGLVQAAAGLTVLWRPYGVVAASMLVLCNVLATVGLFAASQQPFGWFSWIFVAMAGAAVEWARRRARPVRRMRFAGQRPTASPGPERSA